MKSDLKTSFFGLLTSIYIFNLNSLNLVSSSPLAPALYGFGDSLFDSGNNNLLPTIAKANFLPYGVNFPKGATGRFTNGRTVLDFIAEFLQLPYPPPYLRSATSDAVTGLNYASGSCGILSESGSTLGKCISLDEQINYFVERTLPDLTKHFNESSELSKHLSRSILLFSIGSNDYIINYLDPEAFNTSKTYKPEPFAQLLVDALSRQLQRLYQLGLRKFVVFDIGPIGCIPYFARKSRTTGLCAEDKNLLVFFFNTRLQMMLQHLTSVLASSMFVSGQANPLAYDAIKNPSSYGLTNSKDPCCITWNGTLTCIPLLTSCSNANEHFFWDGFHESEKVYSVIATKCINGTTVCSPVNIKDLVQI